MLRMMQTWCPQCGPGVDVDEDGCCVTCGATAVGDGADEALRESAMGALVNLDQYRREEPGVVETVRRMFPGAPDEFIFELVTDYVEISNSLYDQHDILRVMTVCQIMLSQFKGELGCDEDVGR